MGNMGSYLNKRVLSIMISLLRVFLCSKRGIESCAKIYG